MSQYRIKGSFIILYKKPIENQDGLIEKGNPKYIRQAQRNKELRISY